MAFHKLRSSAQLMCDTPHCKQDVLAVDDQGCRDSAALVGWKLGPNSAGPFMCPECGAGRVPAQAVRDSIAQAGVTPKAQVVQQTSKGDDIFSPDGSLLGTAREDAAAGEHVEVDLSTANLEQATGLTLREDGASVNIGGPVVNSNVTAGDDLGKFVIEDADDIFGSGDSWEPDD